jgi:YspA, cpYpsA-related SLOG family
MRCIIAGTRTITSPEWLRVALVQSGWADKITRVLCGDAEGVDLLGWQWASSRNIAVNHYPAHWTAYGKMAGPIRNTRMAKDADALLAIWDGESPGTRDMIRKAEKRGLKVFVLRTR